jgi:hypothetical protein
MLGERWGTRLDGGVEVYVSISHTDQPWSKQEGFREVLMNRNLDGTADQRKGWRALRAINLARYSAWIGQPVSNPRVRPFGGHVTRFQR